MFWFGTLFQKPLVLFAYKVHVNTFFDVFLYLFCGDSAVANNCIYYIFLQTTYLFAYYWGVFIMLFFIFNMFSVVHNTIKHKEVYTMNIDNNHDMCYRSQQRESRIVPLSNALVHEDLFQLDQDLDGTRRIPIGQRHLDGPDGAFDGAGKIGLCGQIIDGEATFSLFSPDPTAFKGDIKFFCVGFFLHKVGVTTQKMGLSTSNSKNLISEGNHVTAAIHLAECADTG